MFGTRWVSIWLVLVMELVGSQMLLFHESKIGTNHSNHSHYHNPVNHSIVPLTRLPLCMHNEHVHGKWAEKVNATKSFPCCGWDQNDFQWNTTLCGKKKTNDWTISHSIATSLFVQFGGHACYCDRRAGRVEVHDMQKYHWVPSHCSLLAFDATRFCNLLGSKRMLFIGDSTMSQTARTLMNLIRAQKPYPEASACLNNVIYAHSNHIMEINSTRYDWADFVLMYDPHIVILGTGAHFHSVEHYETLMKTFARDFVHFQERRVSTYIPLGKLSNHTISFVWKSINPGHLNCTHATMPVETKASIDASLDRYSWGLFDTYDTISRDLALRHNMSYLDMYPLALRPDAHPGGNDCLHYCASGPLDIIGDLLLTKLVTGEL